MQWYLKFVHHKLKAEACLQSLMIGRIATKIGLIKEEDIPNLEIFDTIEEMIESHDQAFDSFIKK